MRLRLLWLIAAWMAGTCLCLTARAAENPTEASEALYPPWQAGRNNDVKERGLEFTVPDVDDLADFHGSPQDPKLSLYVGGNYFFAMAGLVERFEHAHPEFAGKIYWETLPPGLLVKQIAAGGTVTSGNMTWTVKPDAYFAGLEAVKRLVDKGTLIGPAVPYVTNRLTIMIPKGNPARIHSLLDLGKPGIRLVMPNPEFEGIARQVEQSLTKAGGTALARAVYSRKVDDHETVLTRIHHRQSPLFLMLGRADAGITWESEALFQEEVGHPISHVRIPPDLNATGVYAGAIANGAPHPDAARLWLAFLRTPAAVEVFEHYGFEPYGATHSP